LRLKSADDRALELFLATHCIAIPPVALQLRQLLQIYSILKTLPYINTSLYIIDLKLSIYILVARIEEDLLVK
jgi:hypothetical protein